MSQGNDAAGEDQQEADDAQHANGIQTEEADCTGL